MVTWDPADYRNNSPAQERWAGEMLGKLGLCGTERVLDLGCGDGRITAAIAALVPGGEVLGVDSSPEMVRYARATYSAGSHPNLSFALHDFRDLPVLGTFDLAFSNAALHWVGDQVAVLSGVRDNLVPGGRLFFQMGGKGNLSGFIRHILPEITSRPRWEPYLGGFPFPYHFFGISDYTAFVRAAGLVPLRVELIPKEMTYPTPEGLAGWFRTTWLPYTGQVPEADRDELIREVITLFLRRFPPRCDGSISVPMVRLEVEAVKR